MYKYQVKYRSPEELVVPLDCSAEKDQRTRGSALFLPARRSRAEEQYADICMVPTACWTDRSHAVTSHRLSAIPWVLSVSTWSDNLNKKEMQSHGWEGRSEVKKWLWKHEMLYHRLHVKILSGLLHHELNNEINRCPFSCDSHFIRDLGPVYTQIVFLLTSYILFSLIPEKVSTWH